MEAFAEAVCTDSGKVKGRNPGHDQHFRRSQLMVFSPNYDSFDRDEPFEKPQHSILLKGQHSCLNVSLRA